MLRTAPGRTCKTQRPPKPKPPAGPTLAEVLRRLAADPDGGPVAVWAARLMKG